MDRGELSLSHSSNTYKLPPSKRKRPQSRLSENSEALMVEMRFLQHDNGVLCSTWRWLLTFHITVYYVVSFVLRNTGLLYINIFGNMKGLFVETEVL